MTVGDRELETKKIQGYTVKRSNLYPNYGCTECCKVFRWDTEKMMHLWLSGNPRVSEAGWHDKYIVFRTSHGNKPGFGFLHKIVADCWVHNDDPVNKDQVNHIDGDKEHCSPYNLEWVTKSQNQRHALDQGLKQKGQDLYNATLSETEVHEVCRMLVDSMRVTDIHKYFPHTSKDVIRKIRNGDCYMHIRQLYPVPANYKNNLSEETVRWVCEKINKGFASKKISEMSNNSCVTKYEVNRIRYKIRYKIISDEFF